MPLVSYLKQLINHNIHSTPHRKTLQMQQDQYHHPQDHTTTLSEPTPSTSSKNPKAHPQVVSSCTKTPETANMKPMTPRLASSVLDGYVLCL